MTILKQSSRPSQSEPCEVIDEARALTLIRATDLKDIAERWEKKSAGKTDDPFPLGYLIQPGILNTALVAAV